MAVLLFLQSLVQLSPQRPMFTPLSVLSMISSCFYNGSWRLLDHKKMMRLFSILPSAWSSECWLSWNFWYLLLFLMLEMDETCKEIRIHPSHIKEEYAEVMLLLSMLSSANLYRLWSRYQLRLHRHSVCDSPTVTSLIVPLFPIVLISNGCMSIQHSYSSLGSHASLLGILVENVLQVETEVAYAHQLAVARHVSDQVALDVLNSCPLGCMLWLIFEQQVALKERPDITWLALLSYLELHQSALRDW